MLTHHRPVALQPRPNQTTTDYAALNDIDLVGRCLAEEEGAWRALLARYERPMRRRIDRKLASAMEEFLDSDAPKDVLAELYLSLVAWRMKPLADWYRRARDRTGPSCPLQAWLVRLAGNVAADHIRYQRVRLLARPLVEDKREAYDSDPERGGRWLGAEASVTAKRTIKRRRRKQAWD